MMLNLVRCIQVSGDGRAPFGALLTNGSDRSIRPFAAGGLGQFWPRFPEKLGGAARGTRTPTVARRYLKPLRLPIPP